MYSVLFYFYIDENYDHNKYPDSFKVGDSVAYYIGDLPRQNKKLHRRYIGPCDIIERVRENVVRIRIIGSNKELATHVGMIKKYYKEGFTPITELNETELAIHRTNKSNNSKRSKSNNKNLKRSKRKFKKHRRKQKHKHTN